MSRSTFNGPVLIGLDDAPTFTSGVGEANFSSRPGPNWGFVNMVQSTNISQAGAGVQPSSDPMMVIPLNSIITDISFLVTVVWNTGTVEVGTAWDDTDYISNDPNRLITAVPLTSLGVVRPSTSQSLDTGVNYWYNVGDTNTSPRKTDVMITWRNSAVGTGVGRAVMTVKYCQAVDLSAIA